MGKFDCTKTKDFLHEAARIRRNCFANTSVKVCNEDCPLMSDVFSKETHRCIRHSTVSDDIFMKIPDDEFQKIVNRMQAWSDSHPERRELTGDEAAVLAGLKLLGFKHIAADKDKTVWAYTEIPKKDVKYWTNRGVGSSICISYTGLFAGIADFSDENPLVIDEILNERK